MKNLVLKITIIFLVSSTSIDKAKAQSFGDLTTYELGSIKELQVQLTSNIIVKKSTRNLITIQEGFSPVRLEDEKGVISLSIRSDKLEDQPILVVIEVESINSLVAGGFGKYSIIGIDEKEFTLLNPAAHVFIEGNVSVINLITEHGFTNLEYLTSKEENVLITGRGAFKSSKSLNKGLFSKVIQNRGR